jgi:hypothetical protein
MDPMEGRLFLLSILAWEDRTQFLIKLKTKESIFRARKVGFGMMRNGIMTLLSANAVGFLKRLKRSGLNFTECILFWK